MKVSFILPVTLFIGAALAGPVPQPAAELEARQGISMAFREKCRTIKVAFLTATAKLLEVTSEGPLIIAQDEIAGYLQAVDATRTEWDDQQCELAASQGFIAGLGENE